MKPAEFWQLHPQEFWWMAEAKRPPKMYGKMSEHEVAEMYEEAYGEWHPQ